MIDQEVLPSWFFYILLLPLGVMFMLMMKVAYEFFRSNVVYEFFNSNNKVYSLNDETISQLDNNLKNRYEELIKAINNDMSLSFFWLAGSIIEAVLCEYCKKNNIKSSKKDIDGYITALENNNKISEKSYIYRKLQDFRHFRNTIHPDNQNNDFIQGKNLQIRKEDLDDVIKEFKK